MRDLPRRFKDHAAALVFLALLVAFVATVLVPGYRLANELSASTAALKLVSEHRGHPDAMLQSLVAVRDRLSAGSYLGEAIGNLDAQLREYDAALAELQRTAAGESPELGEVASIWSRYRRILEPVAGYSGIPYLDSDAFGTRMNSDGRTLLAATRGALEFGRVNTPGLNAAMASIGANLEGDSVTGATTLRRLMIAGVAFAFILLDFVSLQRALQQMTNTGLVTVVVLLLLSVVLDKSRLLEQVAERLTSGSYRWALLKLYVATGLYSAFLNNTAVVASLIGPLRQSREHAPSRLLMPMCFAASLGGVLTLVGTSTNLLVNSLMIGRGLPGLHIFDLFPVGACIVLACGATMVLLYPRLLKPKPPGDEQASDFFLEATVRADSKLVGQTVEGGGLRRLSHLFLAEMVRGLGLAVTELEAPFEPESGAYGGHGGHAHPHGHSADGEGRGPRIHDMLLRGGR